MHEHASGKRENIKLGCAAGALGEQKPHFANLYEAL